MRLPSVKRDGSQNSRGVPAGFLGPRLADAPGISAICAWRRFVPADTTTRRYAGFFPSGPIANNRSDCGRPSALGTCGEGSLDLSNFAGRTLSRVFVSRGDSFASSPFRRSRHLASGGKVKFGAEPFPSSRRRAATARLGAFLFCPRSHLGRPWRRTPDCPSLAAKARVPFGLFQFLFEPGRDPWKIDHIAKRHGSTLARPN